MFCPNCGKELPQGSKFCPECGKSAGGSPAGAQANADPKVLLLGAGVVILVLLALLLFRPSPGEDRNSTAPPLGSTTDTPTSYPMPTPTPAPAPEPDPAAALVGTWTNLDGVGLKFTSDGTVKLSGFGLTLGSDTFTYEVTGENTLTLTATVGGLVSADTECPYGILDDILYIDIGDYSFELTKK